MDVALWYMGLMAIYLIALWLNEMTGWYGKLVNLSWDLLLSAWCAMMRHTGDPAYTYQPRRYRRA